MRSKRQVWRADGPGRWVLGPHVIERRGGRMNPAALRTWYVVDGPHAHGAGLQNGLTGGFFRLDAAQRAVDLAEGK